MALDCHIDKARILALCILQADSWHRRFPSTGSFVTGKGIRHAGHRDHDTGSGGACDSPRKYQVLRAYPGTVRRMREGGRSLRCRRAMIATLTLSKSLPGGIPARKARIRRRLFGPIPGARGKSAPRPTENQDVMSYARSPLCAMSRPVTSVSSSTRMPRIAFRAMAMMIEITVA